MTHTVAKLPGSSRMLVICLFRMYTQPDYVTSLLDRLLWLIGQITLPFSFPKIHPKGKFHSSKINGDMKNDAEELIFGKNKLGSF